MDQNGIRLIIEGADAATAAHEIKAIFQKGLADDSDPAHEVLIRAQSGHGHDHVNDYANGQSAKAFDPMAVAALVISIPAVILTAVQLTDRLKKKEQLDRAFEQIQTTVIRKKEVTVKIQYSDGKIKETATLDTVEIIDSASTEK